MNRTAWIIFSVAVIALLATLIGLSRRDRVDVGELNVNQIQSASDAAGGIGDRVFGNRDSDVVLIEYLDYQCPGCAAAHPRVVSIGEQYGDDIAIVVRHFPLPNHPNARIAAASAEAVGLQDEDKFWQMHDLLIENQTAWSTASPAERTDIFVSYAEQVGANVEQFREDLASSQVTQKIAFDQALGREHGVNATPSFF